MINETGNPSWVGTGGTVTLPQTQPARRVISTEEREVCDKTLQHLAGRVQELRARLEGVLIPAIPVATGGGQGQSNPQESGSPLTDRFRGFQRIASETIETVEDILNRLDV